MGHEARDAAISIEKGGGCEEISDGIASSVPVTSRRQI